MHDPVRRTRAHPRNSSIERKHATRRDMAVIVLISAAAAVLCVRFDLSEALLGWTRPHERFQLDELPGILLVVAVCLIWFSTRRYLEASRELDLRRRIEARLADALAENRRLAQQYLDSQENERKALARDLHDELAQYVNAVKLDAVTIREALPAAEAPRRAADAMIANIDRVYAVVGGLIRQLRPAGLDELGLAAALEHCVSDWRRRLAARIELSIEYDLTVLDAPRALTLFRLVQEALTNVARHASATQVGIRIAAQDRTGAQSIQVTIADNGCGADLASPRAGLGLIGMRERTAACGGTLTLSGAPGAGFKVTATLPVSALEAASESS
jgi:two-component system, NarL family, sensor histidine kinase UhpB